MVEVLNQYLVKSQCFCLNEENIPHSHTSLFDGIGNALRSNADEQLLLHLSLNQTVKLMSIKLIVPEDETCPFNIKIFVNKTSIGFSDAEGILKVVDIIFYVSKYC